MTRCDPHWRCRPDAITAHRLGFESGRFLRKGYTTRNRAALHYIALTAAPVPEDRSERPPSQPLTLILRPEVRSPAPPWRFWRIDAKHIIVAECQRWQGSRWAARGEMGRQNHSRQSKMVQADRGSMPPLLAQFGPFCPRLPRCCQGVGPHCLRPQSI